jgi:hypothetical protein
LEFIAVPFGFAKSSNLTAPALAPVARRSKDLTVTDTLDTSILWLDSDEECPTAMRSARDLDACCARR